ncbi:hypothetical protein TVAG_380090 [Trichomonas vaginalis G3]|uniref:Uncharacterized protein n=1 Tax=Trichomonas vaginalis (strain ATCC PRA-98 / G3) TaxID=412133 RepID=A2DXE7_TRIV3|nr:hypothetical protein TVAGG3_0925520 [Trichomonas vaginalis G3]EAY14899.1 hypothetical protein TVAG_380090 [Trichomonas vaginalis G3]KAI5485442.1 hypothetical protein TVAGG3_0925520 [Trichomonas vaginalis G3]|eukprot:XP_001327122.1 hypothetical protein [Trichomonas vaginalis G3]
MKFLKVTLRFPFVNASKMEFEQILSELAQFNTFFKGDVEIPIKKYTITRQINQSMPPETQEQNSSPQTQNTTTPAPRTSSASKDDVKKIKDKYVISSKCKCFFISVKLEGSPKGSRNLLFYAPPYCALMDESIPELEVLPSNTEFTFEDRYITVTTSFSERRFSIKSKLDIFKNIIQTDFNSASVPFLLSILGCDRRLSVNTMAETFVYNTLYNDNFLLSFYFLPAELNSTPEVIENWVKASMPMIDSLMAQLYHIFINDKDITRIKNPTRLFPFLVTKQILSMDEYFMQFVTFLSGTTIDLCNTFLRGLEQVTFNARTLMILHIIYYETSLKYPDSQFPLKMVSIALFNASIHPLALEKNPVFSIEELKYLLEFQQTAIALDNLKKYEKILSQYKKQPRDYEPARRGATSTDAFEYILGVAEKNVSQFLNVSRIMEKINYV